MDQSLLSKKKNHLVFGNNLLGRLTNIVVAAGIPNKAPRLHWHNGKVELHMNNTR